MFVSCEIYNYKFWYLDTQKSTIFYKATLETEMNYHYNILQD